MNIEQYEDRMIKALEGDLTSIEYDVLMEEIDKEEALGSIWRSYKAMYEDIDNIPVENPNLGVKVRFEEWLDNYEEDKVIHIANKSVSRGPRIVWRKWAGVAAILVCVFGFWRMYEQNQEVESTLANVSHQMEALLAQQSSTEKIKAIRVNYDPSTAKVDNQMFMVLIDVLNKDQSSNVRLAAVETLAHYMDEEIVRSALIKRLQTESDGGVKLSIITSLGQQKSESIKSTLENIVSDDSQQKFVIDEAHMQLIQYDKIDI